MTIEDQIRDEKLQYDINREQKYQLYHQANEYLTGEQILHLINNK